MCDKGFEIPVWVNGTEKWLSGISKRTTCDDIIYALLYNENIHETENTDSFAIYECWKGVEKYLQGRTKILRVWKNWAADRSNVKFVMRELNDIDESSEYSATKRRYRRWRHQRRYEHNFDRSLCNGETHGRCCHSYKQRFDSHNNYNNYFNSELQYDLVSSNTLDHNKLRRLQKIIKLAMNQEKKIKSLANRIEETELLIGNYEHKIHFQHMQKKGVNYVQRSLLLDSTSTSEDSMDDFVSKTNLHMLEDYIELRDRLIAVCELLAAEEDTIDQLSSLIKKHGGHANVVLSDLKRKEFDSSSSETGIMQESKLEKKAINNIFEACAIGSECHLLSDDCENVGKIPDSLSSTEGLDEGEKSELEALRIQFNRVMTVSVIQNITTDQLNRELQRYNKLQNEKSDLIHSLEKEVLTSELCSVNDQNREMSNCITNEELKYRVHNIDSNKKSFSQPINDEGWIIADVNTQNTSEIPKISKIIPTSKNKLKDINKTDSKNITNNLKNGVNSESSNIQDSVSDFLLKDTNIKNLNNPKAGIAGGAPKSQFVRTQSKRNWTTLCNIRENVCQVKNVRNESFNSEQTEGNELPTQQQQQQQQNQQQYQQHQQQYQQQIQQHHQLYQHQPHQYKKQQHKENQQHQQQQQQQQQKQHQEKTHLPYQLEMSPQAQLPTSSPSSLTCTPPSPSSSSLTSTPPSPLLKQHQHENLQQQQYRQQQQQQQHQQQQQQTQQQKQQHQQQLLSLQQPKQHTSKFHTITNNSKGIIKDTSIIAAVNSPILKLDKSDDTDSTSDTGLGSMHSDDLSNIHIETLV